MTVSGPIEEPTITIRDIELIPEMREAEALRQDYLGAKTVSQAVRRLRVSGGPRPALELKGVRGDAGDARRAATALRKVR